MCSYWMSGFALLVKSVTIPECVSVINLFVCEYMCCGVIVFFCKDLERRNFETVAIVLNSNPPPHTHTHSQPQYRYFRMHIVRTHFLELHSINCQWMIETCGWVDMGW